MERVKGLQCQHSLTDITYLDTPLHVVPCGAGATWPYLQLELHLFFNVKMPHPPVTQRKSHFNVDLAGFFVLSHFMPLSVKAFLAFKQQTLNLNYLPHTLMFSLRQGGVCFVSGKMLWMGSCMNLWLKQRLRNFLRRKIPEMQRNITDLFTI